MGLKLHTIKPVLEIKSQTVSRWISYVGLTIGIVLLLSSLQMYFNLQQLLNRRSIRSDGSDYLSITRTVTDATMGRPELNVFGAVEIAELKSQPFIQAVAPLRANDFRVKLSAGNILPFQTDLFIEAIKTDFLDTVPPGFNWNPKDSFIPLILSSEFLEIYNVFAPGQGLPQVSRETASNIPVVITCSGNGTEERFFGKIVAFSDRVNSVLVPESFMDYGNKKFGESQTEEVARMFIRVKDASDPELIRFLDKKNYRVSGDQTLLGRNKNLIQLVLSGLGIFGILVVVLALLLFSFYLQLVMARSRDNLRLLILLGYSPKWLARKISGQFIPVYIVIVGLALVITQLLQLGFSHILGDSADKISMILNPWIIVTAVMLVLLSAYANYRMAGKEFRGRG